MRTLLNCRLVILLLVWLGPLPTWGQVPNNLSNPINSQYHNQKAKDSSVISRTLSHTNQLGTNKRQPLHQQLSRLQVPNRTPTNILALTFFSAVFGALLFMGLFSAAQYMLNREAPYSWYAVYLTGTSIWLLKTMSLWFEEIPRIPNIPIFLSLIVLLDYSMLLSYLRFVSCLIEMPQLQPRFEHWLRYFYLYIALSILASVTQLFSLHSLGLYITTNFLSYGGLLLFMFGIIRSKHVLKRYALAGTILLVSGDWVSFFVGYSNLATNDQLSRMPLFYIAVSRLLEILCFSLALGQRFYLNKVEKIQAQQELIQQLEENQRLQQTYTTELQRQLAEKETEVLTKAHELEEQRVSQLQSDFERRAAEAEMAGLRSQMNPHFIFNCLNSIKLYATENDSEKASDYLTKFSRLIRLVLENSRSERVTLGNELSMLQLYADMETMRFKQKLSFFVEVEPGIDADFVEIPPLLLQPYVENAIWHGLMHKSEGGTVRVRVSQPQSNLLQLTITDDGVGRARAAELRSKSANHRKSFGLKMTSERIALVNQLYQTHTQVEIQDLVDTDGLPAGTEVVIQILL